MDGASHEGTGKRTVEAAARPSRAPRARRKPTLAVWKFASCDGCQLSLLDCEDELLAIASVVQVANFLEASREVLRGPYDLSLVEGSITTPHDAERIHQVRRVSKAVVSIGACATSGGLQALRNFATVSVWVPLVYSQIEAIHTLPTSTPIAHHVPVDFELRGCPISKPQLIETVTAFLQGRKPQLPTHPVCIECKGRGTVCVAVAGGQPCMGPVTMAGCGAICPTFGRGCYGCFGPSKAPNTRALGPVLRSHGLDDPAIARSYRAYNAGAEAFERAGDDHERA